MKAGVRAVDTESVSMREWYKHSFFQESGREGILLIDAIASYLISYVTYEIHTESIYESHYIMWWASSLPFKDRENEIQRHWKYLP